MKESVEQQRLGGGSRRTKKQQERQAAVVCLLLQPTIMIDWLDNLITDVHTNFLICIILHNSSHLNPFSIQWNCKAIFLSFKLWLVACHLRVENLLPLLSSVFGVARSASTPTSKYFSLDLFVWKVVLPRYSFLDQWIKYFKFWHFLRHLTDILFTSTARTSLRSLVVVHVACRMHGGRLPTNSYYKAYNDRLRTVRNL